MFPIEKSPKISAKFFCKNCNYMCSKQSEFNKHISTSKHKNLQNPTSCINDVKTYTCLCGKIYKHSSTLYAHKNKCKNVKKTELANDSYENTKSNEPSDKELIMFVVKQNADLIKDNNELKTMMMEIIKNGTIQNSNNTTTNSHNKAFNLNFFLNETCKNAMNITDFVESIKLQLSDLERVGELGYVEGISNIIVKNLKDLDVTQRPVHCTDKKRETIYIKDENKWEKDDEKKKIRKLVKKVADKNARLILKFKEVHPDCIKSVSPYSDTYNKIIVESFDNDYDKEEKIIKKISKEVMVEKEGT
jgi:hypothetical protein